MENNHEDNPDNPRKKDLATDANDLTATEVEVSLLASINDKLPILDSMHKEIINMIDSIEFTHHKIDNITKD